MAFASSSFLGAASKPATGLAPTPAVCTSTVRMVSIPEGKSKIWTSYAKSIWTNVNPFNTQANPNINVPEAMMTSANLRKADKYVADCVRKQYIAASNASGVFNAQCQEGSAKFAAEDARVAALAAEYRAGMVPASVAIGDIFEARRRAIVLGQGCGYEEKLVGLFKMAGANAVVTGSSEKSRACVRYADPSSVAEKYMTDSVSKQSNFRAVTGGLYGVLCCDATTSGAAEAKRVTGLAVEYRNGQRSLLQKEDAKRELARFAHENYAHMCTYEEDLFTKFPATAAAMRPNSARY